MYCTRCGTDAPADGPHACLREPWLPVHLPSGEILHGTVDASDGHVVIPGPERTSIGVAFPDGRVVQCRINEHGDAVLPMAAGIDFEVTDLIVGMMTRLGVSAEDTEEALNALRIHYVYGNDPRAKAWVHAQEPDYFPKEVRNR